MKHFIQYYLLAVFGIAMSASSHAQVEDAIHVGKPLKVNSGTELYFIGNYTDSSYGSVAIDRVINLGDIYFDADVTNNGNVYVFGTISNDGWAHMTGVSSQISGSQEINFHNLKLAYDANTDTLNLNKFVIVNDSLLLSSGDILLNDSLELRYVSSVSSPGGLIGETGTNRVYGTSLIKVTNVSWSTPGTKTYEFLKGIGLSLEVIDHLGTQNPVIYRYNTTQQCGGYEGSVARTFRFDSITQPGDAKNFSMKFHDPEELGLLPDGDSMHIYYSYNNRDTWSDIGGTYGTGSVDTATTRKAINNFTFLTAAKDSCDYIPFIQFNQINANVSPIDTLTAVTTAQSCDSSDVSIQVIGDPGTYLWLRPTGLPLPSDSGMYHTFSELGTYTMILEDRRGCIGVKDLVVSSAPNGNADFSYTSANMCDGSSFNFIPDSASVFNYMYEWDMDNDGVFEVTSYSISNYTFPSDGVYTVTFKVTTNLGCSVSSSKQLIIHPIPVASFVADTACPGFDINFDNTSQATPAAGVTLNWDFNNDLNSDLTTLDNGLGTSPTGNATYAFTNEGSYTVGLIASSNGCSSARYTATVTVYPLPEPFFTFTNACEGQPVQFTNASTISDASTMSYEWNFNTPIGPSTTLENPAYTYTSTNSYSVTLEAKSNNGCINDTLIVVSIDENPAANFSFTNDCINTGIAFGNQSFVGSGMITSWTWNFGNGNTSNLENVVESFGTAGTYNVNLTVATSQGCSGTVTKPVTIYDGPSPAYAVNNQCVNTSVSFINTSTNATSYEWNVPSLGQTSTAANPSYTFTSAGWKVVHLEATSSNGCVGNFTDSVEIYPLPNIGLGASNTTCGTSYTLDATDGGNNAGSTYFWNTGATTPTFTATYNGSFGVTVTSPVGCVSSETTTVTLNSAVVPNISDQSGCDLVTLDAGYPGSIYSWTGPSGFTATTQSIDITNLGTASYSVSVTDQNGCVGSASANVTVSTSSPVYLGPDQIKCQGDIVNLNAGTPGSTYAWSTAETTQSIDVTQDGYYSVILTNTAGCTSGDTIQITFNAAPIVYLGADADYCLSHTLNAFASNASYVWSDLSVQPSLQVTASGQYFVAVTNTVTNCVSRDTINLVINPLPVVNLGNDTVLCSYQSVLLESGVSGANYVWNTTETTQDITVTNTGLYSVEVTDVNGCSNSDEINVLVRPIFTFDLGLDRPYCEGASLTLELDTVFPGASFTWSDESGVVGTNTSYAVSDTGTVYLEIVDQYGCVNSDSINVLPSSLSLHAVFLADSKVTIGDSIIFIDLSYPKPYTLSWNMGNGYMTTDTMPIYAYFLPGDYDVSLSVDNGFCESIRTKTITVDPIKSQDIQVEIPDVYSSIESVVLYPNPNNGDFNVKIKLSNEAAVELEIFNLNGQLIYKEKFVTEESIRSYSFGDISRGLYIVRVRSGKDSESVKFIKINN